MKEHTFQIETNWKFEAHERFGFSRDHYIRLSNGVEIMSSSAPAFAGNATRTNPEELFVSSLSSCLMLSYLYLCHRNKMKLMSYVDKATGTLSVNERGVYYISKVVLKPQILFEGTDSQNARAEAIRLVHEAHLGCFISNSVKSEVVIEPLFDFE